MTFMQEIETFLFDLRDNYGFMLPVDRLEQCLACADDITNMEEVYFRMQSLACSSESQIETFRSIFGQKFLHLTPSTPPAHSPDTPSNATQYKAKPASERAMELRMTANQRQSELAGVQKELKEREKDYEAAGKKLGYYKELQSTENDTLRKASEGATPNIDAKEVQQCLSAIREQLEKISQLQSSRKDESFFNLDKMEKNLKEALRSPKFSTNLKQQTDAVMKIASRVRSEEDSDMFKLLLKMVQLIKDLQEAANNTISSFQKQALKNAARSARNRDKEIEQAEQQYRELQRSVDAFRKQEQVLTRKAQESDDAARQMEMKAREEEEERKRREGANAELLIKEKAITHRDVFVDGVRAVQTTNEQAELMETNLNSMNATDKQKILSFIRANARVFRQTLRRKNATSRRNEIDVKATMAQAAKTGGEPIVIRYKEPKKSHAKVIILTDISGSCRHASTLALYFMSMMDEAFPGGCRKFVFVNSLVPVDQYFRDRSPDEGIQAILNNVPSRGVYSDYGTPINELRTQYSGIIHKDTTVIVLGDARTNRYDSRAQDLKYIADRAHHVFWLNTEEKERWNTGDSVIGAYEHAGADVYHVETAGSLLQFLSGLSLKQN